MQAPSISFKSLGKLTAPILITNLAVILTGTIDTIMAGRLGDDHVGTIGLGIGITLLFYITLPGVTQSLSPIAGHHYGARQYELVGDEVQQNMWLGLFLGLLAMPLMMMTDFWMDFSHASGEIARMASIYLMCTAITLPFCMFGRTFVYVFSAVSRPQLAMYVALAMLALKVPLNGIFMYGWGGLVEPMGGAGVGFSFGALNIIGFLCYWAFWRLDPHCKPFHSKRIQGPRWLLIKEQLRVGLPIGVSSFFEVAAFSAMTIFISRLGGEYLAAHQVTSNITSMFYMIPLSIGIATSVLVSQCMGAKWPSLAYEQVKRGLIVGVAVAAVAVVILYFNRAFVVHLYNDKGSAEFYQIATSLLIFGCIYHLFDAAQVVSGFALRGYRRTRIPMVVSGVLLIGVGLGGGQYLAFNETSLFGAPLGAYGLWGMTAVALILSGLTLSTLALWIGRQYAKDDPHTPEEIQEAKRH